MKRLLGLVLLAGGFMIVTAQGPTAINAKRIFSGTAIPTQNCSPGPTYRDLYVRTTTNVMYQCTAAPNTWGTVGGSGSGTVTSIATTSPITGGTITTTGTIACATCTVTVASGTAALGTSAISSATCATVVTAAASGAATTDVITWGFNGDPTGVTGYAPVTSGALTIFVYPSANQFNAKVCNLTTGSITPGAITLNFRIVR